MLDCIKHLTVDAYMIVKAFITYRDAPDGPIAYFANLSSPSNLLRSSFYALQTLLGDFCLVRRYYYYHSRFDVHDTISQIYRCSVVWQHNIRIIILPILFWISCAGKRIILWIRYKGWRTCSKLVTGVGSLISHSKVSSEGQVFSIVKWVAVFFATTLSTNVICTCTSSYWNPISYIDLMYSALIAFRIWSVDRAGRKYRETESTLKPVLAIVIESGAIYSASLMILLVIFFSHSWAYFILPQAVSSFHNFTNHSSSWTWIDNPNHCEIVHAFTYSIVLLTWCVGNCVQHDLCTDGPLLGLAKWWPEPFFPDDSPLQSATGSTGSTSESLLAVNRSEHKHFHRRWIPVNGYYRYPVKLQE